MPSLEQGVDEVGADEARTSGDHCLHVRSVLCDERVRDVTSMHREIDQEPLAEDAVSVGQVGSGERGDDTDHAGGEQRFDDAASSDRAARPRRRRAPRTARPAAARAASTIAAPRIAPIAAGPAPSRNARAPRVGAQLLEAAAAEQDERERRGERDRGGEHAADEPVGGVADGGDRRDHRPGGDLPERDRVEELAVGHPVVACAPRRPASAG